MLPLPVFDFHKPKTLREAVDLLAVLGPKAQIIAGGTDVLPNMKQGLFEPEHVVSVRGLPELAGIAIEPALAPSPDGGGERLVVGAGVRLAEIAESVLVRRTARALAEAAGLVGGPHHRAMGTLGGNICLDTRCRYYNQTYFWRKALGFCLKKDGTVCHVVKGGARCVAAASNDTAPALIALEAEIILLGGKGERRVLARDFYTADGIKNTVLEPGEIVVRVAIPIVLGRRSAYEKLRRRGAIDFPLLSIAVRLDEAQSALGAPSEASDASGARRLDGADVVVSALGARPRRVRAATKITAGTQADRATSLLAEGAFAECKPLPNVDDDTEWRRELVPVLVKQAVERALG
jgi:4-hydroxybenzoyl-CoA reductase subunit beta